MKMFNLRGQKQHLYCLALVHENAFVALDLRSRTDHCKKEAKMIVGRKLYKKNTSGIVNNGVPFPHGLWDL